VGFAFILLVKLHAIVAAKRTKIGKIGRNAQNFFNLFHSYQYKYLTEIPRRNQFAINFAQTGRKFWLNHLKCSIVFAISQ
jgi:hypothetical protein